MTNLQQVSLETQDDARGAIGLWVWLQPEAIYLYKYSIALDDGSKACLEGSNLQPATLHKIVHTRQHDLMITVYYGGCVQCETIGWICGSTASTVALAVEFARVFIDKASGRVAGRFVS